MWGQLTKDQIKEFILSLDLLGDKYSDIEKLKILYTISNHSEEFYRLKVIPKRNGGKRELLVPSPILKSVQKSILNNVLNGLSISKYATAYAKGSSIKDNAYPHLNKKIILKLDIKNFFENTTFEELYKVLPSYIFPDAVKVLLLKLCTYYDYLPQGAPTSPMLSNLVLKNFDNYIGSYCESLGISYTRYSDDLTFSGDFNAQKLKNKVASFLENMGYNLNDKKTKVIKCNYSQQVTGVIVNKKLNTPKSYRSRIRQEVYYINKYGLDNHCKYKNLNKNQYLQSLLGRINFCLTINPQDKEMQKNLKILKNI